MTNTAGEPDKGVIMEQKKAFSGALVNSIGSIALCGAQWLISVLIVRMGGYGDAGIFSLAMSISNVFLFLANYNIRSIQLSDTEGEYTQLQFLWSRVFSILISFLSCAVYLLFAGGYTDVEKWAVLLYLFYSNSTILNDIMMGTIQVNGHIEVGGYSNLIRSGVCLAVYLGVYAVTKSLIISLIAMVAASAAVVLLYDLPRYRKYCGSPDRGVLFDVKQALRILRTNFVLMLTAIFPLITAAVPRRQIQLIFGEEELGYFSSIFSPTLIIATLIPALVLAVIPKLAQTWHDMQYKSFLKEVVKCNLLIVGFTVICIIAAVFLGRFALKLVFGEEILVYYDLLYWALVTSGINAAVSCSISVLIAMHKNIYVTVATAISMIISMAISGVLVGEYGIYGAAYALMAAYIVQLLIQFGGIGYFVIRGNMKKKHLEAK